MSLETKPLKVLVLILSSDNNPIYIEYQKQWKRYMHSHPCFESYFYKASPNIETPYMLEDDCLTIKMEETMTNIFEKTVRAFKFFEPRFSEFDFISRPNLSSFFLLDRYVAYLQTLPRENTVEGVRLHDYGYTFPSGCGYTLTPDVARIILQSKQTQHGMDDVTIGKICHDNSISIVNRDHSVGFKSSIYSDDIVKLKTSKQFHVRTVGGDKKNREKDIELYKTLVDTFYRIQSSIAICYWGMTRSTKHVYKSHHTNLFGILKKHGYTTDVYIHSWKTDKNTIWQNTSSIPIDYEEYKLLEPTEYSLDDQKLFLDSINFSDYFYEYVYKAFRGDHIEGEWIPDLIRNHLCALESQKRVFTMVMNSKIEYDFVVFIRPDVLITSIFDIHWLSYFQNDDTNIIILDYDHYEGFTPLKI